MPKRIVAFLFRRVGDSLLATPALRAVKRHFPDAHLTVIAEDHVARVFEYNPWIDEVAAVTRAPSFVKLATLARQGGRPEIVLDFLSDPRSALAALLSGARQRIGFDHAVRGRAYTHRIAQQDTAHPIYSAGHKMMLVAALGIVDTDLTTEFYLKQSDIAFAESEWEERGWAEGPSVTAFFVHSRRDYKRWPVDSFVQVIKRLMVEQLSTPLVLVTPGDESAAAEIRGRADLHARNVLHVSDLGHLGAVLKRCRLLIGNDGGPKHVAVAMNTPTVTIFGPDPAVYWTPPDSSRHIAISSPSTSFGISEIAAESVYTAARNLLEAHAG